MPLLFAFARKLLHLGPERFAKLKLEIIKKPTLALEVCCPMSTRVYNVVSKWNLFASFRLIVFVNLGKPMECRFCRFIEKL